MTGGPSFVHHDAMTNEPTPEQRLASELETRTHIEEAIEEVDYANYLLMHATTLSSMGEAATRLHNAVSNLKTWHREHDISTGTLPWQREDDEF